MCLRSKPLDEHAWYEVGMDARSNGGWMGEKVGVAKRPELAVVWQVTVMRAAALKANRQVSWVLVSVVCGWWRPMARRRRGHGLAA